MTGLPRLYDSDMIWLTSLTTSLILGKENSGKPKVDSVINVLHLGIFAPVKNPQVAIAVLVEGVIPQDHIQGGLTATPVARDILQAYFNKQQQDSTEFN